MSKEIANALHDIANAIHHLADALDKSTPAKAEAAAPAEPVAAAEPAPEAKKPATRKPKAVKKEWVPLSPPESREKCKASIMALVAAGREQDVARSLDSVDASRLSEVADFALASLLVALELAMEENSVVV